MSRGQRRAEALFHALCLGFSAVLLVLSLLTAVRTTEINDRAAASKAAIAELTRENERLLAQSERSLSLETLERYALQELGMQPCRSEQIVFLKIK